jgi:hypothetical protein
MEGGKEDMKPISEMTTEEKNQEACGYLGICWHEVDDEFSLFCNKCRKSIWKNPNPDFTDPVRLLREIEKREDFGEFLYMGLSNLKADINNGIAKVVTGLLTSFVKSYITNTEGALLDAFLEWERQLSRNP